MGAFSRISQDAFKDMQLEAGMLLNSFNPLDPSVSDADIICATTGGITVTCAATYVDFGEDVDNCPNNTKELKHLDGWDCSIATTALGVSPESIKLSLGAADVDGSKITPRAELRLTDFEDAIWWVGDRVDGGMVAVKMINALSTGGFSLQTTKKGKGQMAITIGGHVSINALDVVPMEFYSVAATEGTTVEYIYTPVTPVGTENPKTEGWYVLVGDAYRLTNDVEVDENVTYYERTEG